LRDWALAQSAFSRVSRSGPTVPVAAAAASVWQPLHPATPVKTALPAAAVVAEPAVDEEVEEDEVDEPAVDEDDEDEDEDEDEDDPEGLP
jgi:hypothetical protein